MKDLFGKEITVDEARVIEGSGRRKHRTTAKGYAAPPGTGPASETCRTCNRSYQLNGGRRNFWKCELVKPTHGPGTDIRLKAPACKWWQAKPTP